MTRIYNPSDMSGYVPWDGSLDQVYFKENGNTLELWWKNLLVHSWTYVPEPPPAGSPIGLLLTLTYPA